jgi:2-C-methyl-D-erythritol 4-phosphate cytidylyltransferase
VDRRELWQAQTPQMFRLQALREALHQAIRDGFMVTDEASAMEDAGSQPKLVEGHADNIKVTRPEDLPLAEFYLQTLLTNSLLDKRE